VTALLGRQPVAPAQDGRHPAARLANLLDPCSSSALHPASPAGGVVAVSGTVGGTAVIAYCTDATTTGGALGADDALRIATAIDEAVRRGCPVVGLWHSGGAKLGDGVESLNGVGYMFTAMTAASGRVPQISVVLGPAAGAAAYGPALTDIVIMSSAGGCVFVTGPDVVQGVTGEEIDMEGLGGADAHGRRSGVVHVVVDSEQAALERARRIVGLFSAPGAVDPAAVAEERDLRALLPAAAKRAYDVRPLVRRILDADGGVEELQPRWAPNMVIALGRLGGRTVGLIANNPLRKGGCLDSLSAEKAARFVRMCDSFGVPLLVLVDVPGYLPGIDEEWGGVVRRGAKLLHAFAEATVPRITLITRKAYGGAYLAMNSRSLGATAVYAWPQAEVAVMGAAAAVKVLCRRQLAAAAEGDDRESLLARLVTEQETACGGLGRAVALGVVDEVIDPRHTRWRLAAALAAAPAGRGVHSNIPL